MTGLFALALLLVQSALVPAPDEGPLANDVLLPADAVASETLARGDATLARARASQRATETERLLVEALDLWNEALQAAGPSASVWVEAAPHRERRWTEGLRHALARRLASLTPAERSVWRGRTAGIAAVELAAAGADSARLGAVEARFPGTDASLRAALRLSDLAAESGRNARATAWLTRASRTLELLEHDREGADALATRATRLAPRTDAAPVEAWRSANELFAGAAIALTEQGTRRSSSARPSFDAGLRPGLAVLSSDARRSELCVQTANEIQLVTLSSTGALARSATVPTTALLGGFRTSLDERTLTRPPGWSLLPLETDGDLLLVQGRTRADEPNALLCLAPPTGSEPAILSPTRGARLRWALVGHQRVVPDPTGTGEVSVSVVPELVDLAELEIQPGPVVVDDLVVVQAREYAGEVRAWLLGLDRPTGTLLWRALVASGSDLVGDQGRSSAIGATAAARHCGEPPRIVGDQVFAGTNLGAAVLVDALDGRPVWSFKNRRRSAHERGWPVARPLLVEEVLTWAPFDSDHAYTLEMTSGEVGSALLGRPHPIDESRVLLGASRSELVVQGRSGPESTISIRGGPGTARIDALYLGPDEEFPGRGLAGKTRVLACTNRGLYLFDRTRELYLLDYAALARVAAGSDVGSAGGDLFAVGEHVLALGRDALWSFRAE